MPLARLLSLATVLLVAACSSVPPPERAPDAPIEGVGNELGYRFYGEARRNAPIVLQNSRSQAVEVFDSGRGVFVPIPAYADARLECRGQERPLRIRYRDSFRESVPFQVVAPCGRDLQFVEPARLQSPRPAPRAAPGQ